MTETLLAARNAFESQDWEGALRAFEIAGAGAKLSSDELLMMGDSLYWLGRYDESLETIEKGFSGLVEEERNAEAGYIATLLAFFALRRQAYSVAGGWMARAEQLLDGEPDSVGHAGLKIMYLGKALFVDVDLEAALQLSNEAIELATKVGSRSSLALAMSFKALAMIQRGDWKEGLALVDEATVLAMTGGDNLRMTSDVYCNTIAVCRNLGDYRRAGEWTDEAERWMHSNSVSGYTGACQVHRAELKRLHGSWTEAEDEARSACVELERFQLTDYLGSAHYEIGEVRRRMGDFDAAQEAFERAYAWGHDAQPGLSLLMVDRGEVEEAVNSIIKAATRRNDSNPLTRGPSRARLLPALIEIALAAGNEVLALSATEELEEIADAYESHVWKAAARTSRGALSLHSGEPEVAIDTLGKAWRMWLEANLPYEMSRTRALLGEARRAGGDEAGARLEFKASLSTLEDLGAASESSRVGKLLGGEDDHLIGAGESRVTRTLMFTDIVTSTDLIELIGDGSWQELLKWHDRTLRSAIQAAGGEEVRHTGDGFFASFADPRISIECAVDIQRRLVQHRHVNGFAPMVRIGIHTAEITRNQGDYSGAGVHAAARIGSIATEEEIVVSAATLAGMTAIPFPLINSRTVSLKGIKEPVQISSVDWR